eukprot:scaffold5014_cov387-Prasinococcus_capsulatus_cf.AAC.5
MNGADEHWGGVVLGLVALSLRACQGPVDVQLAPTFAVGRLQPRPPHHARFAPRPATKPPAYSSAKDVWRAGGLESRARETCKLGLWLVGLGCW